MVRTIWRRLLAWNARAELHYLEMYLAACARQPRPDEAYLRHLRGLIGLALIRIADLED